jgi:hypothetical protein
VSATIKGFPELQRTLNALQGSELVNRTRRGTRAGAKVMRTELRRRAGSSEFPSTFRKTLTRGHRNPVGTSVGIASPLINIFEPGADPHPIGEPGQILTNSETGFFARGPVHHPGMAARPLIGPTFEATKDEAADEAIDTIMKGLR